MRFRLFPCHSCFYGGRHKRSAKHHLVMSVDISKLPSASSEHSHEFGIINVGRIACPLINIDASVSAPPGASISRGFCWSDFSTSKSSFRSAALDIVLLQAIRHARNVSNLAFAIQPTEKLTTDRQHQLELRNFTQHWLATKISSAYFVGLFVGPSF